MKKLINIILLGAIGFFFGSGLVQLAVAKYLGDVKTIDYVVIGGNKTEYIPVDKNVLLYHSVSDGSGVINSAPSTSSGVVDLAALLGEAAYGTLPEIGKDSYAGGDYIERLAKQGPEEGHVATISLFGKTFPVLNSIGKNLAKNEIGRFYFNSDIFSLDASQTKKAFALYAHSYYGLGGAEVGEQIIKLGVGNYFMLDGERVDIVDTAEFIDSDEKAGLSHALEKYWDSKADVLVYTCKRYNGVDGKYFVIGKKQKNIIAQN